MHSRPSATRFVGWLLTLVFFIVSGCSVSLPGSLGNGGSAPEYDPTKPEKLAKAISGATEPDQAMATVQEILALGGIPTADGDQVLTQAIAPAAAGFVIPHEALNLAEGARNRAEAGEMTAADLGRHMAALGWTFPEGSDPGVQVAAFLTTWVSAAQENTKNPHNFTPLFLAAMARLQRPAIDLAERFRPEALRLTNLEIELILAAMTRIPETETESSSLILFGQRAYAAEPCSAVKKWVGGDQPSFLRTVGTEVGHLYVQQLVGDGIQSGMQKLGYSEAQAGSFGRALGALNILTKLHKLAVLYDEMEVTVQPISANPVHKKLKGEAPEVAEFEVIAGVSDERWKDYKDSLVSSGVIEGLRDCLGFGDLPIFSDTGNVAKDAENWRVQWRIVEGSPKHAYISLNKNEFDMLGQLQMKMKRISENAANARLKVDLTPEKTPAHMGKEAEAPVTVEAEVRTSSPLSPSFIANMMKWVILEDTIAGIDGLTEAATGFFQEVVRPTAYGTLTVTYHTGEPQWVGTITITETVHSTDAGSESAPGTSESWNIDHRTTSTATWMVRSSTLQETGSASVGAFELVADFTAKAERLEQNNREWRTVTSTGDCIGRTNERQEETGGTQGEDRLGLVLDLDQNKYTIGAHNSHPPFDAKLRVTNVSTRSGCGEYNDGTTTDELTMDTKMYVPAFDPIEGVLHDVTHISGRFPWTDGDLTITVEWDLTLED